MCGKQLAAGLLRVQLGQVWSWLVGTSVHAVVYKQGLVLLFIRESYGGIGEEERLLEVQLVELNDGCYQINEPKWEHCLWVYMMGRKTRCLAFAEIHM